MSLSRFVRRSVIFSFATLYFLSALKLSGLDFRLDTFAHFFGLVSIYVACVGLSANIVFVVERLFSRKQETEFYPDALTDVQRQGP